MYKYIIVPILFTALLGCSPSLKVSTEEEPGVNLYKYTTYSWLNRPGVVKGNDGPEWLTKRSEDAIRNSIEGQMRRFGFSVCEKTPDLMLHYHVVIKNEVFYLRDWWCDEESWSRYGHCNRIRSIHYAEGTLILDFIDAKNGNQVWRGAVTGAVENLPPDLLNTRIAEAVVAMFRKFPQQPIP
jgi:Domain of unknown function (DUF4136)